MGQAERTVIVHAFDDKGAASGIGFNLSGFDVRDEEIRCSKDDARPKMHKADKHRITFELANRSSTNLRFADRASDAIWTGKDDRDCARGMQNDEIKQVSVGGERLTVTNANSAPARLKFTLNFIDDANPPNEYPYDPIWDNRNGGSN